jgi:cell wall-associated NlpC family hydrolase
MAHIEPWLGTPYLFGGCTLRGVDCSCFTQHVARAMGVSLPRTAQLQYNATERTSSPQPGDLVFFERTYSSAERITHVGIVIGDGCMRRLPIAYVVAFLILAFDVAGIVVIARYVVPGG